jgi:hypothetical protein
MLRTRAVPARAFSSGPAADLLGWSAKQGRILTGGGRAESLYNAERGYPFDQSELPHHHLLHGTTRSQFRDWLAMGRTCEQLVGVWNRPLFTGGWDHSTDADEAVFNVQSRSIFVDLRVPTNRPDFGGATCVEDLTLEQMRLLARQHVFSGYTLPSLLRPREPMVCARHHAIDWNFVGTKRTRPNKWRVELGPPSRANPEAAEQWKEWSFARDAHSQSYYMERWARVDGDGAGLGPTLVLRSCTERDAFIVAVGDHFAFARARDGCALVLPPANGDKPPASLVELVDAAVARGDADEARAWLGLAGGHGRISAGWQIDLCTHPWLQGTPLIRPKDVTGALLGGQLAGTIHADLRAAALAHGADEMVVIGQSAWEIFDRTSLHSAPEVLRVLRGEA